MGLVALLASGASYASGDKELGNAFLGMGKKHLVMGLAGFVLVLSLATAPAALEDLKHWNGSGVRVDEIVRTDSITHDGPS